MLGNTLGLIEKDKCQGGKWVAHIGPDVGTVIKVCTEYLGSD